MENQEKEKVGEDDFNRFPEECISSILSLTTPRDVCRLSVVSPAFNSAAESDALWEKFLPSDYREIISKSSPVLNFSSKKELYFHLCDNPPLTSGGNVSFALEKRSGKKCYILGTRSLSMQWGSGPPWDASYSIDTGIIDRYAEEGVLFFENKAEEGVLVDDFYWLNINGKLDTSLLSPKTLYAAYCVFKFVELEYDIDRSSAAFTVVKVVGGGSSTCSGTRSPVYWNSDVCWMMSQLQVPPHVGQVQPHHIKGYFPQKRADGWMEIEMGYFFNDGEDTGEVQMSLVDRSRYGKSGLYFKGIELRPKAE